MSATFSVNSAKLLKTSVEVSENLRGCLRKTLRMFLETSSDVLEMSSDVVASLLEGSCTAHWQGLDFAATESTCVLAQFWRILAEPNAATC